MTEGIRVGDVWRARGPKRVPEADRRHIRVVEADPGDRWVIVEGYGPSGGRRSRPEAVTLPRRYELVQRDGQPVKLGADRRPARTCGHCGADDVGTFAAGSAAINGTPVCHPNVSGRPDCYRAVTAFGEVLGRPSGRVP